MWQQCADIVRFVRRQTRKHVFQIGMRVVPIELGGLNQAHDRGGALPGPQRSREQPIATAYGPWAYLVLDPIMPTRGLCRVVSTSRPLQYRL